MKMDLILKIIHFWILHLIAFTSTVKTLDIIRHFNTYGPCDALSMLESLYISGLKCDSLQNIPSNPNVTHLFVNGTSFSTFTPHHNQFPNLSHIEITHSKLKTLDLDLFRNFTELRTLNVSHNQISELHSGMCNLHNLKVLVLSHNNITNLKSVTSSLAECTPSLTQLHLSSNDLALIESDDFLSMNSNNLEMLSLSACNLNYVHPSSLQSLRKLKTLILSKNNLTLDNLKNLFNSLSGYPLEELDIISLKSTLDVLPALSGLHLKKLIFGNENIPVIKKTTFPNLYSLRELSIINCNVANITDAAFEHLPNLTSLTITPNVLDVLPKGILLSRLEYLNITGRIWKPKKFIIPDFSFTSMRNLKVLDLSYNFLIRIKDGTFPGLTNLRHLKIRRCGIHYVEDVSFAPISKLLSLDISYNMILITKNLIKKIFHHVSATLKVLVFQQVPLTLSAKDNPFFELINLEHIDLSNSSLNLVSQSLFANLSKIKKVDLSHNQIREWREPIFSLYPNIKDLDLSHNFIVTATGAMLEDFSKIPFVDLSGNFFNCSCEILPFLDWLNTTEIFVSGYFNRDYNNYKCDNPKELLNNELFKVHRTLTIDCNSNPAFAALIVLIVILLLILTAVIIGYLYKYNSRRRLLNIGDNKNFIYDAFISYNANDSDWVFSVLLPRLETNTSDLKLCVYDRDFVAGRGISECILDSIKCSRRTILILSNHFLQSPWCKFEADLAHHVLIDEDREGLLLIKLEELSENLVNPQLNYLLKTKIYLEWSNEYREQDLFWKKLRKALQTKKKKKVAKIV